MICSPNEEATALNQATNFGSPAVRVRGRKRRWSEGGATASPVSVRSSPTPQQLSQGSKRRRWSPHILRHDDVLLVSSPSPGKLRLPKLKNTKVRRKSVQPYRAGKCPYFNASEIAAITGLHKHSVPLHALVRCWQRYDRISLRKWERETGGVSLPEMTFSRHANDQVRDAVRVAVAEGDGALKPDAEASIVKAIQENAPPDVWKTLTEEALGRARCGRGTRLEHTGLDAYEKAYGRVVVRRNQDSLRQQFGAGCSSFVVSGRVDGFEFFNGDRWVVEHKRRQRRLFEDVPQYEEVQCQVYMVLTGTMCCRWVQTLGPDVDVRSLSRCNLRWSCIRERLKATTVLLRQLCSGVVCPAVRELEAMQRDCWTAATPWPAEPAPSLDKKAMAPQEISSMSTSTDECQHVVPCVDGPILCNDSGSIPALEHDVKLVDECRDASKLQTSMGECAERATDLHEERIENAIVDEQSLPQIAITSEQAASPDRHNVAEIPPTMPEEEDGTLLDESSMVCPEIGSQWELAPTELDESETELSANEELI